MKQICNNKKRRRVRAETTDDILLYLEKETTNTS